MGGETGTRVEIPVGQEKKKSRRPIFYIVLYLLGGLLFLGIGVSAPPSQEGQGEEENFLNGLQPVSLQEGARPSPDAHVPELARYLDQVQIGEPICYHQLAIYPILLQNGVRLEGRWLTLDAAIRKGVLVVREKDGGSVPVVIVENQSRDEYVFIMSGEILSGGKQTRTVRQDIIVAPGQRVDSQVFCIEQHRWHGESKFAAAGAMAPLKVQMEGFGGMGGQAKVWRRVAETNRALRADNPTQSLELALMAPHVRKELDKIRREVPPRMPAKTMGMICMQGRRPVGADFFGDEEMTQALLPKLLEAYAVDCVLLGKKEPAAERIVTDREAVEFFKRIVRAGSQRSQTPGSGAGIQTQALGLIGEGVSFKGTLVHYGVRIQEEPIPLPYPKPMEGYRTPDQRVQPEEPSEE